MSAAHEQQPHSTTLSSSRALFSTQPKISEEFDESDQTGENSAVKTTASEGNGTKKKKAPSILKSLPENYTTGAALNALRRNSAGGQFIRLTDFRDLALSARRGYKRDATSILTALKDFKRNNAFILDVPGATAAMEGMLRARIPADSEEYGSPTALDRVAASLYVLDAFIDENTGLYYASSTELVESNMTLLLEAVRDVVDLRLPAGYGEDTKEDGEKNGEGGEAESEEVDEGGTSEDASSAALAERVLHVTRDTVTALIKRGRDPSKHMKKRAARKYRKHLRVDEGPTPSTAHVGVEICLALGASAKVTREMVLSTYQSKPKYENWFPPADDATLEIVLNAEKTEQDATRVAEEQARAAAKAAAAAEAADAAAAEAAAAQEADNETTGEDEGESEEPSEDDSENGGEEKKD